MPGAIPNFLVRDADIDRSNRCRRDWTLELPGGAFRSVAVILATQ